MMNKVTVVGDTVTPQLCSLPQLYLPFPIQFLPEEPLRTRDNMAGWSAGSKKRDFLCGSSGKMDGADWGPQGQEDRKLSLCQLGSHVPTQGGYS